MHHQRINALKYRRRMLIRLSLFFFPQFLSVIACSHCCPVLKWLSEGGNPQRHHRWRTWWRWPHRCSPLMDRRNSEIRVTSIHQTAFSSSRTRSRITRSRPQTKRWVQTFIHCDRFSYVSTSGSLTKRFYTNDYTVIQLRKPVTHLSNIAGVSQSRTRSNNISVKRKLYFVFF